MLTLTVIERERERDSRRGIDSVEDEDNEKIMAKSKTSMFLSGKKENYKTNRG